MKKKPRAILVLMILILFFGSISFIIDSKRIHSNLKSIVTVPITTYKDDGSVYRIGVGYGVFEWRILSTKVIDNSTVYGEDIGDEIRKFKT